MRRILIVKQWAYGDVLLATPLLRALKMAWPDCRITWLGDLAYAGILANNPLIDDVIPFDSKSWRYAFRRVRLATYVKLTAALIKELKAREFDIVINLVANKWWALLYNFAPIRVGLFPSKRAGLLGLAYTYSVVRPNVDSIHNSRWNLMTLPPLGIAGPYDERMVVGVGERAAAEVETFLNGAVTAPQKPIIILHPGTSQESKCWPADRFTAVAAALLHRYTVVITGSPNEQNVANEIAGCVTINGEAPIVAAGVLSTLEQTIALVARAQAVVTGDTSMVHIASTLEIPTVCIYGSTRPNETTPLFGNNELLFDDTHECAPCYKSRCRFEGADHLKCLKGITVETVLGAIDRLLSSTDYGLRSQSEKGHSAAAAAVLG